ncbi:MAG: J domain-containing protein [Acidimicrobiales bacterium]|nr:J domain-containing protein [Acidimicrobiales bacterium]
MSGWRIADHYRTLGLDPTASPSELRRAYLRLARQNHPDSVPDSQRAAAAKRMGRINAAWAELGDAERRRAYDARGRPPPTGAARPTPRPTTRTAPFAAGATGSPDLAPQPQYHVATPGCAMLSPLPLLLIFGLLAAIVVFTAYATASDDPVDRSPVLSGRTDVAAYRVGGCVEYYQVADGEVEPVAVPCDGGHDAIIRRVAAAAVSCGPDETAALIPATDVPLCLVPFAG